MPAEHTNAVERAIEMRGVAVASMHDPDRIVLDNIEWSVRSGEFWVIAGTQGSGRSDLLLLAGGLMSPARGEYFFLGEPMPIFEESRLKHRLRLGYVFESGQVFGQMTTAENVALPLRYHENVSLEVAGQRVAELLEVVELTRFASYVPTGLTRNWQKRVGLARALMLKPEVLVLDEPLSGLNARHAAWWLNFLEQLCAGHSFMGGRRMTIIAAADDLRPWQGINRHFAVINGKTFSVVGSHEKLAASADPLVKEFVFGAAPAVADDTTRNPKSAS
jgi:phospholipid/cholesterol/gamma-HCH transport system ATP-binding protein